MLFRHGCHLPLYYLPEMYIVFPIDSFRSLYERLNKSHPTMVPSLFFPSRVMRLTHCNPRIEAEIKKLVSFQSHLYTLEPLHCRHNHDPISTVLLGPPMATIPRALHMCARGQGLTHGHGQGTDVWGSGRETTGILGENQETLEGDTKM